MATMADRLTVPDLGEGIESATVVEIFVKAGDSIETDQSVLSLETDKAQFELPSTVAGKVAELLVDIGDEVSIGQAVLAVEDAGGESLQQAAPETTAPPAAEAPAPPDAPEEPKPLPQASEPNAPGIEQPVAEPASPPTEPEAPERSESAETPPLESREAATPAVPAQRGPIAAAPSVRRLARELGVQLERVAAHIGSDRVTKADVEAFKKAGAAPKAAPPAASPGLPPPAPLPDFSRWGEIEIEEMSKIRRKTAENMARAWIEIPTVTHYDEADITKLEGLRKRYSARVKEAGGHLTWTAILLHVVAGALRRFPVFNASVDMASNRIIHKKYVHIGVAVDTERGLLVPVIRDADEKNIVALAKALNEVSEAARSRNIKPDMMQGATFTITNLGGVGGVGFSPIVNPPQVAILGVSRSSVRPVWVDDKAEPRQILPLSLSYDHRIIDGADAARFLRWVCEALEEPFLLDLEGQ